MQIHSLQELLKQYIEWNFDFDSVSIATQIPEEELRQLYSDANYRLKPDNDGYYRALLESLTQYFKIPPEVMADYIGVDVGELLSFESSSDKERIEKYIAHLFTTFIRDPRFSV